MQLGVINIIECTRCVLSHSALCLTSFRLQLVKLPKIDRSKQARESQLQKSTHFCDIPLNKSFRLE